MFVSFFFAVFSIIAAVRPVTADLSCNFDRGACDWRELKSNCSWGVSSKKGLAFVQDYCANATLKANIGWYEKKDLYLKYYMNGQGDASLTVNAGIGSAWWNAKPVEVYSCDQSMGINWKTDRIRLPDNTQYVTIEAVISKDAEFVIALDQIKTGNFESLPEFVKTCTHAAVTTESLPITSTNQTDTSDSLDTSEQTDASTTMSLMNSTHENVTSTTSFYTAITTLPPTKISSGTPFYETGRNHQTTTPQSSRMISKIFIANYSVTDPSTSTLPLSTAETSTIPESTSMTETTSLPPTAIHRDSFKIRKYKYVTSSEIITTTNKDLITGSYLNPTEGATTTGATTWSEPTPMTHIPTSTEPTTTASKIPTTTYHTTTTDYTTTTTTISQTTTQPLTSKETVTRTTSPKVITAHTNIAWNGRFYRPKTVYVTQRTTTPAYTRKTIPATTTTTTTTTPPPPPTTTTVPSTLKTARTVKVTTTVKPTWKTETTTSAPQSIITSTISTPSTLKTTTYKSDDCLYCFNDTDSTLNDTTVHPYDSDATIEHLSTIVVVASFFGVLLIYGLLKLLITSLMRWRKKVKVDKNEKDMPHRSQPISPELYTVDDTGLNGQNLAASGPVYRTRQDSVYHMELPSRN